MEKSHVVAKLYGYVVCLVAVIVLLVSVGSLVKAWYDLKDPMHVRSFELMGPMSSADLASFESYKISRLQAPGYAPTEKTATPAYTPSDDELHKAYDAAKEDQVASVRLNAHRTITVDVILIIIAALLFWYHWSWLAGETKKRK